MMCFGAKLNDPFNKKLVNCAVTLVKNANSEWMGFFLIRAVKVIKPKDELYMEYGPDHWMYLPNFNELQPDQKVICKEYYELEDDDFYGPKTTYQEELLRQYPPKWVQRIKIINKLAQEYCLFI